MEMMVLRHSHALCACAIARDVEAAGMRQVIRLSQGACADWAPAQKPFMVVTNPPWGVRLTGSDSGSSSEAAGLEATWRELGLFLKVLSYACCLFTAPL
jgi:23S rRNA G2445 N2-methylase RlmL